MTHLDGGQRLLGFLLKGTVKGFGFRLTHSHKAGMADEGPRLGFRGLGFRVLRASIRDL